MATPTTTIDALPAAAGVTGTQLLVVQETGVTKRASVDELVDYANAHLVVDLTASEVSALLNPSVAGSTVQAQLTGIIARVDALFAGGGGGGGSLTGAWYRWEGTQEEYDVLPEYRDDTLYAIHDAPVGPPTVVPPTPLNVQAVAGDASATISWASAAGATSYTIERSTLSTTAFAVVGTVAISPFLNQPLTNGTTYYFRVTANNAVGSSAPATPVAVTPDTVHPVAPGAPTNVSVQGGDTTITVNWLAPASDGNSPITSYEIEMSVLPGGASGPYSVVATTNGNIYSRLMTGLTNGTVYWYRVRAVNAIGTSGPSSSANTFPTAGATVPSAPLSVAATPDVISATIDWAAPASNGGSTITSYKIERSLSSSSGFTAVATVPGTTFTVDATALNAGTTYYFRVLALNALGTSAPSGAVSVVPTASGAVPALWQDAIDTMDLAIVTAWYDDNTGYDTEGFTSADLWTPSGGAPIAEVITSAWLTTNTGPNVVFASGRWTITGLHAISINIRVNNVTLYHCFADKPVPSDAGGIGLDEGFVGGIADHCTLAGNFAGEGDATYYYNPGDQTPDRWTMRYCDVSGYRAGYLAYFGCTAEYNWTHDLHIFADAHNTAASIRGQNCRFYRCYLGDGTSGALSLYAENTPYSGIIIEENVFAVNGHATGEINFPFKAGQYMVPANGENRELIGNYFVQGYSGDNAYFTEIWDNKLLSTGKHLFMDNGGTRVATEPIMLKYRQPDFNRSTQTDTYEFTPTPSSTLFVMVGCQNAGHTTAQSPVVTAVGQYVSGQTFTKIMESADPNPADNYGVKYWLYKAETGATVSFEHITVDPYPGTSNEAYFTTWVYEVTGRTGMTLAQSSTKRVDVSFGAWTDSIVSNPLSGAATTGRLCMAFVACSAFDDGNPGLVTGWTRFGEQPNAYRVNGALVVDDFPAIVGCAYWRKDFTGTTITIPDLGSHVASVGVFLTEWT